MFKLLTSKRDCMIAFRTLKTTLQADTKIYKDHKLGWPGGSGRFDVHWNRDLGYWCYLDLAKNLNRFWCVYGLDDPKDEQMLSLTVEINTLATLLQERDLEVGNDQPRDLFITNDGRTSILFEVKTNLSTGSIYGGVGQLFVGAAFEERRPRLVLVLPGKPIGRTSAAINQSWN